jgi:threonylcarbamoyladenosine tRNA methylthiotransferase MtaB
LTLPPLTSFKGQTRAFLKVQDGCDGYCTYCIIPKTRPFVHYKPIKAVLQEAKSLVKDGHREIVVTGVFLGAYGQKSVRRKNWPNPQNGNLADLLEKMAKIPYLSRIRLSSLEPADVTPQLLDTFCKHTNIMPHLHLSLQSGSDAILKKMCRQYNSDLFREKIELAKLYLDRPAITTDIIVGFPGETDDDFKQTVRLAKDVGFAKIHVFSFSPRKGTAAANMQDRVNIKAIKERSKILHSLNIELSQKFQRQFIGQTAEILLENYDGQIFGRSERYFMVYLEKTQKKLKKNDLIRVKLVRYGEHEMYGNVL